MRKKRQTERKSSFEKCYRLLEYLKKHTNEEHRLNQKDLRKMDELSEYIGEKGSFNDRINMLADTLNYNENGIKEEKDWQLVFDAFTREFGDEFLEDDTEFRWHKKNDDEVTYRRPVKNIYYKHIFSYDEINKMEEGILFSKSIGAEEAKRLIGKIEDNLTNKYYKSSAKSINTIYEPDLMGKKMLEKNLNLIAEAIRNRIQMTMIFGHYDLKNKLVFSATEKQYLSPYYLVAYGGRYYLLCAYEMSGKAVREHQMYILRVDLMKDVELPDYEPGNSKKRGIPATPKEEVKDLPEEWDEKFQITHLNMTFGTPVRILLPISRFEINEKTGEKRELPCTFLHDWFGDTYRYMGPDPEDDAYALVSVRCPSFAMENWALQYSDRVEVIEPEEVREAVRKKVTALSEKYK